MLSLIHRPAPVVSANCVTTLCPDEKFQIEETYQICGARVQISEPLRTIGLFHSVLRPQICRRHRILGALTPLGRQSMGPQRE